MRTFLVLALGVLYAGAAPAQGTFLWTWHGDSNFFTGTFEVTAADMDPNGGFTSQLFHDSVHFVVPDGYVFDSSQLGYQPWGRFFPQSNPILDLDIRFATDAGRGLDVSAMPQFGVAYIMGGGGKFWDENGYWTYAPIPEPSSATLFGLGVLAWAAARMRRRRSLDT